MRILYLHQYFMTRAGIGGTRSYEFARRFAARGHEVSMVTVAAPGEASRRRVDGIDVLGVRAGFADYVTGTKLAYPRRALEFARFAVAATTCVLRMPRPDVIYATSPPLTMALPALAAARRHRVPLVFEVRDLWPEAPIQMGVLTNPLLKRLARGLERHVYRSAAHVIALSPGMREGVIAAGTPAGKVTLVPNASDLELFSPDRDGSEFRERLRLGDRFVCSYFGTMGEANDLTQVIEAAALMDDDVRFVLHGDGKRRPALERLVRERGVGNVVFSDPLPDKDSVARLAAASDACMTIYKDVPILCTCSPNKLFDTFAAGRAAIVNTPGWLQQLVEQGEAGVYVRPADPAHLADRVAFMRDHPELVERYGRNARKLAETEFSRDMLTERALGVLERAAAGR
ncbi:MAG TPA: glycosyltransferase family 4 protein [Thermoleophilaceae bacterium]|nr:glycosyltransferase family 4 protein [Thermoleophilaceae bacterium]